MIFLFVSLTQGELQYRGHSVLHHDIPIQSRDTTQLLPRINGNSLNACADCSQTTQAFTDVCHTNNYILLSKVSKTFFVFPVVSFTSPAIPRNSGILASPIHSYKKLSLVVTTAPAARSLASAMGTSS